MVKKVALPSSTKTKYEKVEKNSKKVAKSIKAKTSSLLIEKKLWDLYLIKQLKQEEKF